LNFCWHKKNQKYRHSTFFENNISKLFIAAQTFRVILYKTAQSIFVVEPSARACWKGILNIEFYKNKKNHKNSKTNFFLIGFTENGITQKTYF
jgi:hypothetical protein